MKQLRVRVIILACWLVFIFNVKQFFVQIDISYTGYILILFVVFTILIAPRLLKIPIWAVLTVPTLILLLLKFSMGEFISSTRIALSIIEEIAIIVSVLLTTWVSISIRDFESVVSKIAVSRRERNPEPHSDGYGLIYREVRRARNHQRPLALVAIAVDKKSLKPSNGRIAKESQLTTKLLEVSTILCDELEDCSVIVQGKDHFLVALPETKPEEVPIIIERLRRQVTEKIGIILVIGIALFPKDGFTFEGLVEKATGEMKANLASQPLLRPKHKSSDEAMAVLK
jgi:GGDEF domain-containing protein